MKFTDYEKIFIQNKFYVSAEEHLNAESKLKFLFNYVAWLRKYLVELVMTSVFPIGATWNANYTKHSIIHNILIQKFK